jgi:3-deoxy-D-manno-octulosonic-acid transferase
LVPRHFERAKDVARQLESATVPFIFRTELQSGAPPLRKHVDCLLVNTTGELKFFYERADVVFIGKSLTAEGGQSPIEAGAQAKAMIFGPNMQNFASISDEFLSSKGAVQIKTAGELEKTISELLLNPAQRAELGKNAKAVVDRNTGAVERTVEMILDKLPREIYVQPAAKNKSGVGSA